MFKPLSDKHIIYIDKIPIIFYNKNQEIIKWKFFVIVVLYLLN